MKADIYYPKYVEYGIRGVAVIETGHDYDFIASIDNETDDVLKIYIDDLEGWYSEPITIQPHDWGGIEANDEGYSILNCIKSGDFRVIYEEGNE